MISNVDNSELSWPVSSRIDDTYLKILFETLEPYLTYASYPAGKRISFSAARQTDCFFIRTGAITLYRQPDDILLDVIEAPTIRGIIPVHKNSESMFVMRAIDAVEIATLAKEQFYDLLTKHSLWEAYARHLQLIASIATEILFKIASPTVFQVVRYQLYELISKPEEIRLAITAESYIRGKTRLSRSAIMNTLSALKTGGYISIENGHLMSIKYIPAQF
ncbi:helix-turn-helix domain-containing protein [Citrobacter amalonaticus]|uniref:helix-turn-helix domain-containing protein n=1 Tax=Citrobacter amalonaticus TaxID=35703 RepID=UPI00300D7A51